MKKTFMPLGALSAALLSLNVYAQDNSWKHCYVGASASFLESDNQWSTNTIQGNVINDNAGSAKGDDTAVGLQFGCNFHESADWVFGAKLAASDNKPDASHLYQGGTGPDNIISYETKDVVSLIARVGFKINDNGLMYGNLGYTQSSNLYQDNATTPLEFSYRKRASQRGLLVGVGYEHKLSNQFSLFAEYNHTDLGDNQILLDDLIGGTTDYRATVEQDLSQFNFGVNFSF